MLTSRTLDRKGKSVLKKEFIIRLVYSVWLGVVVVSNAETNITADDTNSLFYTHALRGFPIADKCATRYREAPSKKQNHAKQNFNGVTGIRHCQTLIGIRELYGITFEEFFFVTNAINADYEIIGKNFILKNLHTVS